MNEKTPITWFSEKRPQQIGLAAHYISLILFPLLSQPRWDANFLLVHNQINPRPATGALNLVEAESNIRERVNEVIAKMHKSGERRAAWTDRQTAGWSNLIKNGLCWKRLDALYVQCVACLTRGADEFFFLFACLSLCECVPALTLI